MAKVLKCSDIGHQCDFVARGETDDDIMAQAVDHAAKVHGMHNIPPDVAAQVKGAIHNE